MDKLFPEMKDRKRSFGFGANDLDPGKIYLGELKKYDGSGWRRNSQKSYKKFGRF
jgi:hypothetical protein